MFKWSKGIFVFQRILLQKFNCFCMDIEENRKNFVQADFQHIQMQNRIGRGCQGSVYNAYNQKTMEKYAVKVMNTSCMTEKERERLKSQIQSNVTLSSKSRIIYFPYFYGYWTTKSHAYLVFEKCQGNALQGININRSPAASYSFAYVLLYDVLNALQFLQSRNIVHRDLKPENILLDRGHFKICDLGLSRIVQKGKKFTIDVGNIMSRSPQFYTGDYDCKTDIWSLGINVFWLAFGNLPFGDQVKQLIKKKKISDIISRISKKQFEIDLGKIQTNLVTILSNMLQMQKENRLTATQLLEQYFRNVKLENNEPSSQIKYLLIKYLTARKEDTHASAMHLIILLLVIDFTKMDQHLKKSKQNQCQIDAQKNKAQDKKQQMKKEIVVRVKLNIYYIMKFIQEEETNQGKSQEQYCTLIRFFTEKWRAELEKDSKFSKKVERSIKNIDQALDLHKIKGIYDKFPLVPQAIRIYKLLNDKKVNQTPIYLWNVANLDLRKLKI